MEKICGLCGEPAVQKCAACSNVYYCSKKHQKEHWKHHSLSCKPYKINENPELGRHYVAVRNIKAGEIILKEDEPLVAGPMHNSPPVCLSCYKILQAENAVPCINCGWPLCTDCQVHGPECEFTSTRKDVKVSITDFGLPHPSYQCINVIRALALREVKPEAYRKLLSLEDHAEVIRETEELVFEDAFKVISFVKRFFKVEDIPDNEIRKIVGALQINGHEVPITEPAYMAVYDEVSFLEHSCRANCSKSFTSKGGLVVYAAEPILKKEHISICYTDSLWGAANRRHHLLRTKFFECHCDRCKDPTEFGTMFNAIKCTNKTCQGYMLPETFLSNTPLPFECKECQATIPGEKVDAILEAIGIDLMKIQKNSISACEAFLHRYKDILHENHFYNIDLSVALVQLIGQVNGIQDVDDDLLQEKIRLGKKLDEILQVLAPAENRVRGLILFEMHAALAEFGRRQEQQEALALLMESKKCLETANRLLEREPEVLPEGQVARMAAINLKEINAMLNLLVLSSTNATEQRMRRKSSCRLDPNMFPFTRSVDHPIPVSVVTRARRDRLQP